MDIFKTNCWFQYILDSTNFLFSNEMEPLLFFFFLFCSFDFAFVDAEKRMYSEYFELLLQLVMFCVVVWCNIFNARKTKKLPGDSF